MSPVAADRRRIHDSGRSGLYQMLVTIGLAAGVEPFMAGNPGAILAGGSSVLLLIAFPVPLISPLLVLWWLTRSSQPGANRYGPNPHKVMP